MRIVFIGAGSVVFTRNLTRDILTFPELADCEIVLMDIDGERLARADRLLRRMVDTAGAPTRVTSTTDRRQALSRADSSSSRSTWEAPTNGKQTSAFPQASG